MSDNFKHDEAYYLLVLDLPTDFDEAALKKAYRKKAKEWHPDRNKNDVNAEEKLKLINEAYEFLGSKVKSTEEQEEYNEEDYFWFKGKRYKRGNRDPKEKDVAEHLFDATGTVLKGGLKILEEIGKGMGL